jgi:hypothetical protein
MWGQGVATLALVVPLIVGCASRAGKEVSPAEQLRAAVDETILDQDRHAKMEALSSEYLDLLDRLVEEVEEGRSSLDRLVADYDSERDQFDAFFADYTEKRSLVADRMIEIHLAMKQIATPEEWAALEKATQSVTSAMLGQHLVDAKGEE